MMVDWRLATRVTTLSRSTSRCGAVLLGSLLFCLSGSSGAQETATRDRLDVSHILDWERVADPQISPDGRQVVYARSHVNQMTDRWVSELWVVNVDGSRNRFLVKGNSPRWSPDGTRLAFLADGESDGVQIHVRWMDAEAATTQLSHVNETPADLRWAPNGRQIAFTMLVESTDGWPLESMPSSPDGGKWTEPPRVVRKMHYRQDRVGFLADGYRHLFVIPADGGTPRQLTEGSWHVGSRASVNLDFGAGLDWMPDSRGIVFDGSMAEDSDTRYRESHLYLVALEDKSIRRITSRRGPWAAPAVSPDGTSVAFTGYEWTAQTYKVSDLFVIGIDGQGMHNLSSELDRDVQAIHWAASGDSVYFHAGDSGTRNVHAAAINGGLRRLTSGTHMLSLGSVSNGGLAVGIRSSFHEPADVVRFDLSDAGGGFEPLTSVNDDVLADRHLGEVEEVWYDSTGDEPVQGWLVKPPDFDSEEDYPLILYIHGGPHGMYNVGFNNSFQNLAANGYLVLYTNPRGSTGYGTDFGNAIDNGYPSVDHEDLMAGVDHVLARGFVDAQRLYVTGCSGGGVLSSWAIGQTDRFAAAAIRCPVTNWMSFAGTADVTMWGYYRYHGYPWDNAEKYLKHSPLMYVGNVTTPTLLMTGELDLRTPMSQTEEYYQALKALKVPAVMVRFHHEYHGTSSKPSNFMRTQLYMLDWFAKHSRSPGGATESDAN